MARTLVLHDPAVAIGDREGIVLQHQGGDALIRFHDHRLRRHIDWAGSDLQDASPVYQGNDAQILEILLGELLHLFRLDIQRLECLGILPEPQTDEPLTDVHILHLKIKPCHQIMQPLSPCA